MPFETLNIDFALFHIEDGTRKRIDLVRPFLPGLKSPTSGIRPEFASLLPRAGNALQTSVNFGDWRLSKPHGLVSGYYELQASWVGTVVQNGKHIDAATLSNVLRL